MRQIKSHIFLLLHSNEWDSFLFLLRSFISAFCILKRHFGDALSLTGDSNCCSTMLLLLILLGDGNVLEMSQLLCVQLSIPQWNLLTACNCCCDVWCVICVRVWSEVVTLESKNWFYVSLSISNFIVFFSYRIYSTRLHVLVVYAILSSSRREWSINTRPPLLRICDIENYLLFKFSTVGLCLCYFPRMRRS